MPIHASNVMLVHKGKTVRLGYKIDNDGKKVRVARSAAEDEVIVMSLTPSNRRRHRAAAQAAVQRRDQGPARRSSSASSNVMQVPTLEKIVINMGVGRATAAAVAARGARSPTSPLIAGQKPIVTKAKQLDRRLQAPRGPGDRHQGHAPRRPHVGVPRPADRRSRSPASATSAACPPTSWDGRGNYTFGLNDQTVFPEIDYDKIDHARGHGHHDRHHRDGQRRRQGAARRVRLPVQEGRDRVADNEPRRSSGQSVAAAVRRQEEVSELRHGQESTHQQGRRKPKFKVRGYTRCRRCGRARSVYRKFGLCRVCLRELAHAGEIPGLTKSSW